MSRSGVVLNDSALSAFNEFKLGKKTKFIVFEINDGKTEIIVSKESTDADYDNFLGELPENDCRYAVYNFDYETASGQGKRSKIVFVSWAPDTAPVKSKMIYASSREAIRRALNGIAAEVQGTDFSEVAFETVLEKVSRFAGNH